MMNARRLLYWGDLEETRRRRARGGLSPWVYSVAAGVALSAVVARGVGLLGADAAPAGADKLWLAAVLASHIAVMFAAPFRIYWRRDSAMIGRSAIPGRAIFAVALVRSVRAAAKVALPCAMAAAVFALGPHGDVGIALRHLVLVGVAFLWAGVLGPGVALAAGAIVASETAQAAISSIAGEFQAPRTSWLGILPGVAGTGLALLLLATASWSQGGASSPAGNPIYLILVAAALPPALLAWAWKRADAVMLAAVREVAALDQERLAHVELSKPSPLERLAGRIASSRGSRARLIVEKDATLARRRYPIPFFLGVVGLAAQWILAVTAPADVLVWAAVVSAGLGGYGAVMARRAMVPPIEYLPFLRTLPVSSADASRGKRARLALWVAVYMVLGAAPVVLRAPEPARAALVLGAICAATLAAGAAITRITDAPP